MSLNIATMLTIGAVLTSTFVPNTNRAKGLIGRIGDTVDILRQRQKALGETVKRLSKEQSAASLKAIAETKTQLSLINRRISALKQEKNAVEHIRASYEKGAQRAKRSLLHVGAAIGITQGVVGKPLRAAMEHESGMLGVVKQMDGLRDDETKQLTDAYYKMEERIWQISEQLPIAKSGIISMFESAGQMGIKTEETAAPFVLSVGKTAIALELDPGKAAEDMAKLSTIFQIPAQEIEARLMDYINFLSDNSPAKGAELIEILKGMGGTAKFAGMEDRDSAAFASVLMSLSSTAQIARTAGNALIRELSVAESQPKRFQDGLKALKLNAKDLQAAMAKDAAGTIVMVLEKIRDLPAELRSTVTTQLYGKEYGDDISKLAINVERIKEVREAVRSGGAKGSIQKEFEAKERSYEYKLIRMNNQLERLWVNLGMTFIEPMGGLVEKLSEWGKELAVFAKEHREGVTTAIYSVIGLIGGGLLAKVITFIYGFGQAMLAAGNIAFKVLGNLKNKVFGNTGLEYELQQARDRNESRRRARRSAVYGRSAGRATRQLASRGTMETSLRAWRAGSNTLGMLGAAWGAAGRAARVAALSFGGAVRVLAIGFRGLWAIVRANPLFLVWTSISMLIESLPSLQWFIKELRDDFTGAMRDIKAAIGAGIEAIERMTGFATARGFLSDKIEGAVNWWRGTTPGRADAPVKTRRELDAAAVPSGPTPPSLPLLNHRGSGVINNQDNSTTTINITQQPGEDGAALARRTAQELERARLARQRGAMHDLTPAF